MSSVLNLQNLQNVNFYSNWNRWRRILTLQIDKASTHDDHLVSTWRNLIRYFEMFARNLSQTHWNYHYQLALVGHRPPLICSIDSRVFCAVWIKLLVIVLMSSDQCVDSLVLFYSSNRFLYCSSSGTNHLRLSRCYFPILCCWNCQS